MTLENILREGVYAANVLLKWVCVKKTISISKHAIYKQASAVFYLRNDTPNDRGPQTTSASVRVIDRGPMKDGNIAQRRRNECLAFKHNKFKKVHFRTPAAQQRRVCVAGEREHDRRT